MWTLWVGICSSRKRRVFPLANWMDPLKNHSSTQLEIWEPLFRDGAPVAMPREFPNASILHACLFFMSFFNTWSLFNKGWCTGVSPLYGSACPGYAGELNLTLLASHKTAGTLGTLFLSLPTSGTTSWKFRWPSTHKEVAADSTYPPDLVMLAKET